MFRAKATKMLHRDFCSLDKLEEIEKKERLAKKSAVVSSTLADTKLLDPALADQLANFDLSNLI